MKFSAAASCLVTKPSAVAKNEGSPAAQRLSGIILHTDFPSHKMHSPVGHVIISPLSRNKGRWEISALTAKEGLQGLLITGRMEDVGPSRSTGPHVRGCLVDPPPKKKPVYISTSSFCCKTHKVVKQILTQVLYKSYTKIN